MKKLLLIILLSLLTLTLPACRSKKDAAGEKMEQPETVRWKNVAVPIRLEIIEPQKVTLSGRLTMVRNDYALISLRMLGFEVGQIYLSPEEADVVIKQINKMWIQEPIGGRFAELKLPFATLQEALLGQQEAFERLPKGLDLTLGGSSDTPVLTLKLMPKGKTLLGSMTLYMSQAQWDSPRPATFTAPKDSEYKKVGLKDLSTLLK